MPEYYVESGPYANCVMKIEGGHITYTPKTTKPQNQDGELYTAKVRPDSPIKRELEESSSDCEWLPTEYDTESECECEPPSKLEELINDSRLSKITGNKLKKHFAETDVPPDKMMLYYRAVVDALIKKKTFISSIELGEFACL